MTAAINVEIQRLPHAEGLALPAYQTAHAAGLDLQAAVSEDKPLTLLPGQRALVPTGLMIAVPPGHEAQVRAALGAGAQARRHRPQLTGHGGRRLSWRSFSAFDQSRRRAVHDPARRAHSPACHRRRDAGKSGGSRIAAGHGSRQRRVWFHREVDSSLAEDRIAPHRRARSHYFAARFTFTVWTLTRRLLLRILSFDS